MTLPFLAAKTHIPTISPNLVSRPHLLEALDRCLPHGIQLVLVSAPAGAGKTTLLAQWLRHLPANWQAAWLALETGDNHLERFFAYLEAAIQQAISEFGGSFTNLSKANPNLTPEHGVAYLVEQVVDAEQNLMLVLDDYHTITNPEIHQALKLLIDHLPPNLRPNLAPRLSGGSAAISAANLFQFLPGGVWLGREKTSRRVVSSRLERLHRYRAMPGANSL